MAGSTAVRTYGDCGTDLHRVEAADELVDVVSPDGDLALEGLVAHLELKVVPDQFQRRIAYLSGNRWADEGVTKLADAARLFALV